MPNSGYFITPFAVSGDLTPVPEAVQPSGSVSYTQGWGPYYAQDPTIDPSTALFIDRAQTNQLFNDVTTAIQFIQQHGCAPFITSAMNGGSPFSYKKGAIAAYDAGAGLGNWISNITANTSVPGADANWSALPANVGYFFSGGTASGSTNTQTVVTQQGNYAHTAGNTITWKAGFSVSSASTLNPDGAGALTLKVRTPDGLVDTVAGDIIVNQEYMATDDGTYLQLIAPSMPSQSLLFQNLKITQFTGNGTWTPDAKMLLAAVGLVGSGGSGGGTVANGNAETASGGAAAGALWGLLTKAQAGASQAVTIAAAATGATAGANDGNNGSTTSLGALLSAAGGGKGFKSNNIGGASGTPGGTGGTFTVSVGTLLFGMNGQDGGYGMADVLSVSGTGGDSLFGAGGPQVGGNGTGTNAPGKAGTGYGSGSSGASNGDPSGASQGSANSQPGFIVIIEILG